MRQYSIVQRLLKALIPAPEQHESGYLLPEKAVDGGVVLGI
jgi:hypothetical protein